MVEPESGNIATNELTSPKTLGTGLNSSMGKSAGKWASTPPLLPIKSYAAVEPELMKEIEKLQHRQTSASSFHPFATVSRFRSLISFFPLFPLLSFSLLLPLHPTCLFFRLPPFVPTFIVPSLQCTSRDPSGTVIPRTRGMGKRKVWRGRNRKVRIRCRL